MARVASFAKQQSSKPETLAIVWERERDRQAARSQG
jgi:hypothetical protein